MTVPAVMMVVVPVVMMMVPAVVMVVMMPPMVMMMVPPVVMVVMMPPVVMVVMVPAVVMMVAVMVVMVAMPYLLDQPSRLRGFARRLGEWSRLGWQRHHGKAKKATENVNKLACHVRFPKTKELYPLS